MFIFGMTTPQVESRRAGGLDARDVVAGCPALAEVLDALRSGVFSPEERDRYRAMADRLEHADPFFVLADFDAYDQAQNRVDAKWANPAEWWRVAVLNTAGMGWFSADRTIEEYAAGTWGMKR